MIPVSPQPEPTQFDALVRQPGEAHITGSSGSVSWARHEYWRQILQHLGTAYDHICAYSAMWISPGGRTVDHFLPKSEYPNEAYEWGNYRLADRLCNCRKGQRIDLVDPFLIPNGCFVLRLPSLQVDIAPGVTYPLRHHARATIDALKLNDMAWLDYRWSYVDEFRNGRVTLTHLATKAPFLASELRRQCICTPAMARQVFRVP